MSSAAVAKFPKLPPSSFSILLRRSKFATYDPQIGQIYTTYDGSAHRGDWGIKRPLAVRRRDARLVISNIDTLYQQTEWTSAYNDAMAVRKFEEMRVTPSLALDGQWSSKFNTSNSSDPHYWRVAYEDDRTALRTKWMQDSDYARAPAEETEKDLELSAPIPNPHTMGPKRFERYLRRLRRLGPEFREIVEKEEEELQARQNSRGTRPVHVIGRSVMDVSHKRFLGDKVLEACRGEGSTFIRPFPHPTGGLTYVNSGELQTALEAKAVPGRRVDYEKDDNLRTVEHEKDYDPGPKRTARVALGGWVAKEQISLTRGIAPPSTIDLGNKEGEPRTNEKAGRDVFRPMYCQVVSAPQVVGKDPKRLDVTTLRMSAVNWSGVAEARPNPYKPGSAAYIAMDDSRPVLRPHHRYPPRPKRQSSFTKSSPTRSNLRHEKPEPRGMEFIARLRQMVVERNGSKGEGGKPTSK